MMFKPHTKAPRLCQWIMAALMLPAPFIQAAPTTLDNQTVANNSQTTTEQSIVRGYIKDELFVYIHAGSSTKFKILGSINAGSAVEQLDINEETNFIKIKDDKGRIGWIKQDSYTQNTPKGVLLTQAQQQLQQLQSEHQQAQAQLGDVRQTLAKLKQTNKKIADMLELSEREKTQLQQQLTENKTKHNLTQMIYGAGIIVVGLILGLILPHLAPRKRRSDHWVN